MQGAQVDPGINCICDIILKASDDGVYSTQNSWVFRLCPSSCTLKSQRGQRFGNLICLSPKVRWETPPLLGSLERVNLNHWTSYASIITVV
jgi:hypothetical protein